MFFLVTFKEAVNILGGLDIIVNNAAIINEVNFHGAIDNNVVRKY
jgi:NAD(P)-dependent dehydrogenase (short-subunit alcohol dehydrogenase family)